MKIKKWWKRLLILLVGGYILLCVGVYLEQERIIFHPVRLAEKQALSFDFPFQEHFLTAADGERISVLYARAENPKGVILLFHGNSGNLQSCGEEARGHLKRGYDVLMPDYRGFGHSSPKLSEEALLSDALLCYDYLRKQGWKPDQVVLYGMSLGTGLATYVASKREARLLLVYAPYYSMQRLGAEKYPFIPSFLLKYPLRSDLFLPKVQEPVYVLQGTHDGTIPLQHARDYFALTPNKGRMLVVKGGKHNDLMAYPEARQFVDEVLR